MGMLLPDASIQALSNTQVSDVFAIPLLEEIKNTCRKNNIKIVVLDDDPTGTQTVYDVPVITNWDDKLILQVLQECEQGFFILTNSRSLPAKEAFTLNKLIAQRLKKAAAIVQCDIIIISRGDSTLRGHFPGELFALEEGWGDRFSGYILMPYFKEGNRYTIDNIHYLLEDTRLIPVADTVFAKDPAFGYQHSDLRYFIEEKTLNTTNHESVNAISIEQLNKGVTETEAQLEQSQKDQYTVVNATCSYHAAVFTTAFLNQWMKGNKFLVRSAASLVQALFGIHSLKLLIATELMSSGTTGGLIIVGSFVTRTTEQLDHLTSNADIAAIEAGIEALTGSEGNKYIQELAGEINTVLITGRSVVIYTSRKLSTGQSAEQSLQSGNKISEALVSIVKQVNIKPAFIIAKGGITSSDIAVKSLNIQRAKIAGQLLPGIPVWIQGSEAKFPGMPYIIFPGNVGTADYMTLLFNKLTTATIDE